MAGKITEYRICSAHTNSELASYVNMQLRKGYQPYGFVYSSFQDDGLFFHQVMVKTAPIRKGVAKKKLK